MKQYGFTAVGLLVAALTCLPAGVTGRALASNWQEKFILLITNTEADNVVAYSQFSGRYLGVFIPRDRGGLEHPDTMVIGPDDRLYISSGTTVENSAILRFNVKTGAFID